LQNSGQFRAQGKKEVDLGKIENEGVIKKTKQNETQQTKRKKKKKKKKQKTKHNILG